MGTLITKQRIHEKYIIIYTYIQSIAMYIYVYISIKIVDIYKLYMNGEKKKS